MFALAQFLLEVESTCGSSGQPLPSNLTLPSPEINLSSPWPLTLNLKPCDLGVVLVTALVLHADEAIQGALLPEAHAGHSLEPMLSSGC